MPASAPSLPLRLRAALTRRSVNPERIAHAVSQRTRQLDLVRRYRTAGCTASLGTLMLLQRSLIDRLITGMPTHAVSREDLRQEGYLAVARAARLFDPEAGTAFATFAIHHINAAIRVHLHNNAHIIRLSCHKGIRLYHEYRRNKRAICGDADAALTPDTAARLSASFGCSVDTIHQAEAYSRIRFAPLDPETPADIAEAEDPETVRVLMTAALRALERLPEVSRAVLWYRFLAPERLSLRSIAARQGLDLKRARELERDGLRQLRVLMAPAWDAHSGPRS